MNVVLRSPTPIFVGVSGHRDPVEAAPPTLEVALDDFFSALGARYPSSDVILLTGMARGGDRLAAERARSRGIPYVVVLPMPLEDYRDGVSAPDRAAFEATLGGAATVVEIPLAGARAAEAAPLGGFLRKHCAILFALRDDETVDAASDDKRLRPIAYRTETGLPKDDARLEALDAIDLWNARASGPQAIDAGLCKRTFDRADALAIADQKRTYDAIERVFWYTLLSGLAFSAYGHPDVFASYARFTPALSILFVLLSLAAIATVSGIHKDEVQNRFADRRVLAEGLRIERALLDAGLDVDVANEYLVESGVELEWVRRAIDAAYVATALAAGYVPGFKPASGNGLRDVPWIGNQRTYYEHAAAFNRTRADRANRIAIALLRASIAAAALVAVDGFSRLIFGYGLGHLFDGDGYVRTTLMAMFGTFGSLAALVKGKATLRGYALLATRYETMATVFGDAATRLRDARDASDANAVVVTLAKHALRESGEWHASERSRPLTSALSG